MHRSEILLHCRSLRKRLSSSVSLEVTPLQMHRAVVLILQLNVSKRRKALREVERLFTCVVLACIFSHMRRPFEANRAHWTHVTSLMLFLHWFASFLLFIPKMFLHFLAMLCVCRCVWRVLSVRRRRSNGVRWRHRGSVAVVMRWKPAWWWRPVWPGWSLTGRTGRRQKLCNGERLLTGIRARSHRRFNHHVPKLSRPLPDAPCR